jgi:putative tryptophan/tyrosine transport system substrate-binding protein
MPDPVEHGLVASLARPGGNVTGLSLWASDLAARTSREVVPDLRRIGVLAQVGTNVVELVRQGPVPTYSGCKLSK